MNTEVLSKIRTLGALTFCVFLAACGGAGGNGQGDTTSTEVAVEGHWSGTYAPPGATHSTPVYALIVKDGSAVMYDDYGWVYRMPKLNGSYTVQGNVSAYAPIGYQFTSGSSKWDFAMNGTVADSGIQAQLQNANGNGDLALVSYETLAEPPAAKAGQWMGYYVSPTPTFLGMVIDASGNITGDDAFGCHLTGSITQRSAGENLFDVTLSTTGTGPVCGTSYQGLAHETDYDTFGFYKNTAGTYYYLAMVGPNSAFAAEVKVQ